MALMKELPDEGDFLSESGMVFFCIAYFLRKLFLFRDSGDDLCVVFLQ